MIRRPLRIGRWVVDFLFAVDGYDVDGVLACLYDCRASRAEMSFFRRKMEEGVPDEAFTYANPDVFRAVVCIGPTTSGREFQNSFVHEIRHLVDVLARSAGIHLDREKPAYLAGDTAMELADVVCRLGCDRCRRCSGEDD